MRKCDFPAFDVYLCLQDEEFRARPRLDIILPLHESYEEISSDALTVRNFRDNECRDYRLGETMQLCYPTDLICEDQWYTIGINAFSWTEHSEGESLFYIISPKDIVGARERDQDDHIDWLLEKKKYEVLFWFYGCCKFCSWQMFHCACCQLCQEALMAADISFKNIKRHDVQKIGMAYINHLVEKGDYDTAAR